MTNKFGYFKEEDPQLPGLKFGNWGSRPFEYFWASFVEDFAGVNVVDIGVGLPSEHDWHEFVRDSLKPQSYLGIDLDARLKDEEIHEPSHRVMYMNAKNIDLADNSTDLVLSLSTFEHFENVEDFNAVIAECFRILRPQGKLVVTLDEYWDKNKTDCLPWNELERAWVRTGRKFNGVSFGMVDFAKDISKWFSPVGEVALKANADQKLLNNQTYNVCVSHGVFEVNK